LFVFYSKNKAFQSIFNGDESFEKFYNFQKNTQVFESYIIDILELINKKIRKIRDYYAK